MSSELFPCPICKDNVSAILERDRRIAVLEAALKIIREDQLSEDETPAQHEDWLRHNGFSHVADALYDHESSAALDAYGRNVASLAEALKEKLSDFERNVITGEMVLTVDANTYSRWMVALRMAEQPQSETECWPKLLGQALLDAYARRVAEATVAECMDRVGPEDLSGRSRYVLRQYADALRDGKAEVPTS